MSASVAEKLRQKSIEITISVDQKQTVDEAEAALIKLGGVYVKARVLVQVVRDVSESNGLVYQHGTPVIARIGRERLRELLGASATWLSTKKGKGGKPEIVEVQCPPWAAATLEQRGQWLLPWLDAISDAPVLRPDGTLHDRPGYDVATRTIYDAGAMSYPAIPKEPTIDDAQRSYAELVEPMCDVRFVGETDRAAWASFVLTLIGRGAIDGCTPLFLVRAPIRGAGKGLAVDVAAVIATGRKAPKRQPTSNEDEMRKAFLAYGIESPALVLIDNIDGALGGPVLASVLTAGVVNDRLLGANESRTVPIRFVLAATGNNVQLRGDLARRVVPIDINPECENPEDRRGFRYPDLIAHVRRERPRLVAAALTILRGYFASGLPAHGMSRYGSFEGWDALIRGAVVWASGHDPLGGIARIRAEGDEDTERLAALLASWRDALGDCEYTAAEVIRNAQERTVTGQALRRPDLHDALAAYCRDGKIEARGVGNALKKLRDRICDGHRLERRPGRAGLARWRVSAVGSGWSGESGWSPPATRDRETDHLHWSAAGNDQPQQPDQPVEAPDSEDPS